ncbi:unnamed protein product [Schistocephalus solidus]|uniref:Uncharacterized protein n=1 Tax=Schistocephalus solidus TaxID=70667 RepID=A0A183SSR0_SCHSO|nr:unnamed protein product [Schistocephalus solidus]
MYIDLPAAYNLLHHYVHKDQEQIELRHISEGGLATNPLEEETGLQAPSTYVKLSNTRDCQAVQTSTQGPRERLLSEDARTGASLSLFHGRQPVQVVFTRCPHSLTAVVHSAYLTGMFNPPYSTLLPALHPVLMTSIRRPRHTSFHRLGGQRFPRFSLQHPPPPPPNSDNHNSTALNVLLFAAKLRLRAHFRHADCLGPSTQTTQKEEEEEEEEEVSVPVTAFPMELGGGCGTGRHADPPSRRLKGDLLVWVSLALVLIPPSSSLLLLACDLVSKI